MALTVTPLADRAAGSEEAFDDSVDATIQAVVSGAKKIVSLELDNSLNSAATFFKMWDLASGSVTVGTTAPDWIIKVAASEKPVINVPSADTPFKFATAISWAAVTTAGTAGTTSPTSAFKVRAIYKT